jgi:hypothetical protein
LIPNTTETEGNTTMNFTSTHPLIVAASGNNVDRIRFTWMTRDATLWFDEAAVENLFSGSYCGVADADYLGRVDFAGGGDFIVEAKPYREGP